MQLCGRERNPDIINITITSIMLSQCLFFNMAILEFKYQLFNVEEVTNISGKKK